MFTFGSLVLSISPTHTFGARGISRIAPLSGTCTDGSSTHPETDVDGVARAASTSARPSRVWTGLCLRETGIWQEAVPC